MSEVGIYITPHKATLSRIIQLEQLAKKVLSLRKLEGGRQIRRIGSSV